MVFSKIITAKQRAYGLYLRRESNASFKVIADKWNTEKFCSANMRSSAGICQKGDSVKKRTVQESIGKTQANHVSNSEQNASCECELYSETVNGTKRIYNSAGM